VGSPTFKPNKVILNETREEKNNIFTNTNMAETIQYLTSMVCTANSDTV